MIKPILISLALLIASGSLFAQRDIDLIITMKKDSIVCRVIKEEGGYIYYKTPESYKTRTLYFSKINQILLNPNYDFVNLTYLIDYKGYVNQSHNPKANYSATGRDYIESYSFARDSVPYSDSALLAILSSAGDNLIRYKNQYYNGIFLVVSGSALSGLGSVLIIAASPIGIVLSAAGAAMAITGSIITIISVSKAGEAGYILKEVEKFHSVP